MADVHAAQCAARHGTFGEGEGRFPKLVGGVGSLRDEHPEPTVGNYWPFARPLGTIKPAMPMPAPHTLSADDVYALTAYIPNLNDLVPQEFVADRDSLPRVKMRNRDSFTWTDPPARYGGKTLHERLRQCRRCRDIVDRGGPEPDAAHHRAAGHDATEVELRKRL